LLAKKTHTQVEWETKFGRVGKSYTPHIWSSGKIVGSSIFEKQNGCLAKQHRASTKWLPGKTTEGVNKMAAWQNNRGRQQNGCRRKTTEGVNKMAA